MSSRRELAWKRLEANEQTLEAAQGRVMDTVKELPIPEHLWSFYHLILLGVREHVPIKEFNAAVARAEESVGKRIASARAAKESAHEARA